MKEGAPTTHRKDEGVTGGVTMFRGKVLKAIVKDAQMDSSYTYCACGSGGGCGGGPRPKELY